MQLLQGRAVVGLGEPDEARFPCGHPNKLWPNNTTEFRISAGKVYLSPIVDCFDGVVVSWAMSTSPSVELASLMFDEAVMKLGLGEHPAGHSDRGIPSPLAWLD